MTIPTGQTHENDTASLVLVCKPSLSKAMGALHPAGALYAGPVNLEKAMLDHENFVALLRRRGITVREVSEVLCSGVEESVGDRVALEDLAARTLHYTYSQVGCCPSCGSSASSSSSDDENASSNQYWVTDEYKRKVLSEMTPQQLVDVILTNPRVTITPTQFDTGLTAAYTFEPLSNVMFVRDQQITTKKGVVMARLRSKQREKEVAILVFVLRKLGVDVLARVPAPCFLEGGDFFPAGDMAFVGVGPRSNFEAVQWLMENDLLGVERVAVVKDRFECRQERMHLDTVFNIIGERCAVMLSEMMGEGSRTRRVVDEYVRGAEGYELVKEEVEFSRYVRGLGWNIIEVSGEEQLKYGCNVLNLGNGRIVSSEKETARRISTSKCFEGTVEYIDFDGVSCMYGGLHCASQVVLRKADGKEATTENGV